MLFAGINSSFYRNAHSNNAQPAIRATPPMGVMAPSHVTPVRHRTYKEPEKISTPPRNE